MLFSIEGKNQYIIRYKNTSTAITSKHLHIDLDFW